MLFCMVFGIGMIYVGQEVSSGKLLGTPALWRKKIIGEGYRIILIHETFGRCFVLTGALMVTMALCMLV